MTLLGLVAGTSHALAHGCLTMRTIGYCCFIDKNLAQDHADNQHWLRVMFLGIAKVFRWSELSGWKTIHLNIVGHGYSTS